jgi:hypothetical protein
VQVSYIYLHRQTSITLHARYMCTGQSSDHLQSPTIHRVESLGQPLHSCSIYTKTSRLCQLNNARICTLRGRREGHSHIGSHIHRHRIKVLFLGQLRRTHQEKIFRILVTTTSFFCKANQAAVQYTKVIINALHACPMCSINLGGIGIS